MWVLLALLAAVGIYEYTKSKGCGSGCCCAETSTAGPTPCGLNYAPIGGCDGTGSGPMSSCCGISSDPSTWPTGDSVWDVCRAIAIAEGANDSGSAPDRYNNPGDLSQGDEHGQAVSGYTRLPDGENLIVFETKTGGWQALYTKINNIRLGISLSFSPSMTWQQIAAKYAGNSAAWVNIVTSSLRVSPSDTFGSYFA